MPTLRRPRLIQADIDAIQQRMERMETEVNTLADKEDATTGDLTRSRRLLSAIEGLAAQRAVLETEMEDVAADENRRRDALRSKFDGGRNTENSDGASPYGRTTRNAPGDAIRSQALRTLDDLARRDEIGRSVLPGGRGDQLERLIRRDDEAYDGSYLAERLLVTESTAYRSAFQKYIDAGMRGRPMVLSNEESDAVNRLDHLEARRAMSENTTTAGGFGVPSLIDPTLIVTSGAADVPLLRVCRVEQVTNNLWKGVSSAGMTWSYDTEAAEVSDDTPTLAQPSVLVHMARGFLPYSIEVSQDYTNFASEMMRLLDQGYTDLLAQKLMVGSGTGEPWGLFTALDANTNVEVVTTTDGSFGGADVFKVWNALPERYRSRATWVMSTHVQSAIRQFAAAATTGSAYFTVDLTGGTFRINERPVILTDYAPTFASTVPGTTGAANILAVGDFQNYLFAQRAGMSVETVQHVLGASRRPTGERALFAWARNGGDMINDLGARLLQNQ